MVWRSQAKHCPVMFPNEDSLKTQKSIVGFSKEPADPMSWRKAKTGSLV